MNKGDLVIISSLPEYWGAKDALGSICLIVELISDSNYCNVLLGNGESLVISTVHLEIVNEFRACKASKKQLISD